MGFKCGIVGLPNVGKSTLFNALTASKNAEAANFPFCTIDPNIGIVDVLDERLDKLSKLSNSKKKIYANITFVDIAGLIKGASKGEGLGNEFLSNIHSTDVIAHVVRFFKDKEILHVKDKFTPLEDYQDINLELILADINTTEKYLERLKKSKLVNKEKEALTSEIKELLNHLSKDNFASSFKFSEELASLSDFKLLTNKPMFVVANIKIT